jgi:S1-C subfamily serine protease
MIKKYVNFSLAIFFFLSIFGTQVMSQDFKFTVSKEGFGAILDASSRKILGSGFIAGKQKHIVTCAHVVVTGGLYLFASNQGTIREISFQYVLPRYDLAVFSAKDSIKFSPIEFGDIHRIRPGDRVVYLGWNEPEQAFKVDQATVTATGSALNEGVTIQFLEFEGFGIPGYSGGPVFDSKGKVVAIMREAWLKKGIKGGKETLINRAFSIEAVWTIEEQTYSGIAPASPDSQKIK